jgi:hypothetical protein
MLGAVFGLLDFRALEGNLPFGSLVVSLMLGAVFGLLDFEPWKETFHFWEQQEKY